ncbi:hypothetical protein HOY80DRAFT_1035369 [Tuber brumale]|nr:hypothetical protein HOY80DRAFT_1035369 [Tuber brumale]
MYLAQTTLLLATAVTSVSAKTGNPGDAKVHPDNPIKPASSQGSTAHHGDEGPPKLSLYEAPVSGNGKCDGAKNVLDPFQRGNKPECDRKPQTCQVGDLIGKHGEIPKFQGVISVKQSFQDLYLSLMKEEKGFIGNGTVVVKNAKGGRIACADITEEILLHGNLAREVDPFMPERLKGNGKGDRHKSREHKSWLSKLLGFHRGSDDYYRGHYHHRNPWGDGKKWDRDADEYNDYR